MSKSPRRRPGLFVSYRNAAQSVPGTMRIETTRLRGIFLQVAPFTPAGERTKKAASRGGRTGSNGQQHPVLIGLKFSRNGFLGAPLRVTRHSENGLESVGAAAYSRETAF